MKKLIFTAIAVLGAIALMKPSVTSSNANQQSVQTVQTVTAAGDTTGAATAAADSTTNGFKE